METDGGVTDGGVTTTPRGVEVMPLDSNEMYMLADC
jgi:hypothetical protein